MSVLSLTYQQSVFKHYHSDKHLSEFYLQDGGKNQLAKIWNKSMPLPPYVLPHGKLPYATPTCSICFISLLMCERLK